MKKIILLLLILTACGEVSEPKNDEPSDPGPNLETPEKTNLNNMYNSKYTFTAGGMNYIFYKHYKGGFAVIYVTKDSLEAAYFTQHLSK